MLVLFAALVQASFAAIASAALGAFAGAHGVMLAAPIGGAVGLASFIVARHVAREQAARDAEIDAISTARR